MRIKNFEIFGEKKIPFYRKYRMNGIDVYDFKLREILKVKQQLTRSRKDGLITY